MSSTIHVGVSSCLLGNPVRYDGGHKRDRYITDTLGKYFRFVPVCPEVECGLPVPRESMHLAAHPDGPRLVTLKTGLDHTERMQAFCAKRVESLEAEDLCGFIFKSDSPSSGLHRVKIYHSPGISTRIGRGLFADAVAKRFPLLPLEEEGRLHDAKLRENFIGNVFACRRWKDFLLEGADHKTLIAFHTREKLLVMSHSPSGYTALGRLVAGGKAMERSLLLSSYEHLYMEALSLPATVKKNRNVLHHIMGYFKTFLSGDEKEELLEVIGEYALERVPLTVPLTLVSHYVRKYDIPYLKGQTYLQPHPSELMLRNHV
ncbi:MAG: DUF523 and DUF1722 domain-containing protein [Clostridia bacterium]